MGNMTFYYLLLIPAFLLGMYAQFKLKANYTKYSQIRTSKNITGADAARYILDSNGLQNVQIEPISGQLTDHYDPSTKIVRLSEGVYNTPSVAAVGIAAHECGHAIQHSVGYGPLALRNTIIPLTNIGSQLALPLILLGLFLNFANLITIGVLGYSLMAVFQLITLPVEFNASSRALKIINQTHMVTGEEYQGVKATLSSAAMTYVAALVSTLVQLLPFISLLGRNNRGRRK